MYAIIFGKNYFRFIVTAAINSKHVPSWVNFTVKSETDVSKAVEILKISYKRIKDAIDAGEPTGYFSYVNLLLHYQYHFFI